MINECAECLFTSACSLHSWVSNPLETQYTILLIFEVGPNSLLFSYGKPVVAPVALLGSPPTIQKLSFTHGRCSWNLMGSGF
jgi:hypothetical protein